METYLSTRQGFGYLLDDVEGKDYDMLFIEADKRKKVPSNELEGAAKKC